MPQRLPAATVVGRRMVTHTAVDVPVRSLVWDEPTERIWELPEGVCLAGPAPEQIGLAVERRCIDSYSVRLLWDRNVFGWESLSRVQLLTSCLGPVLQAAGSDLRALLDQPIRPRRLKPMAA